MTTGHRPPPPPPGRVDDEAPTQVVAPAAEEPVGALPGKKEPRQPRLSANNREILAQVSNLDALLTIAQRGGASDLLLKVGQTPMFRLHGELYPLRDGPRVDRVMLETLAAICFTKEQLARLDEKEDVDGSYFSPRSGRARINLFRQRGEIGLVLRLIPSDIPTLDNLGVSSVLRHIAEFRRGLVLVTGATGSGKSTTLAALIEHINRTRTAHIITIEDPIEFAFTDRKSIINQRELGVDTKSFASALRSALRQAPDVILVGELRDVETMEVALQAAETGHLVMSTIHTNDAADAMTRILSAMGTARETVVRQQLAEHLRAVISQRLVKRADKKGRCVAQEILINTATIREKVLKGATPGSLRDFIAQGQNYGMQTFDQHLFQLYQAGLIDYEEGYNNATNRDDFDLKCRGISSEAS